MLHYPAIDPVAFRVGPVSVHWYGIMYLLGFLAAWGLANYRAPRSRIPWNAELISDLIFYSAMGVILGGRIGYTLFYNLPAFLDRPWVLVEIWKGGMSFHGGLIGVVISTALFARLKERHWCDVIDFVAPLVPIGLGLGRLGNFINGEVWGRVSSQPWAMVFPAAGPAPRHPSQLYELFFEGIVLFVILWFYSAKPRPRFAVSAVFALCYGIFRFCLEFVRQPDADLGFLAWGWLTMGQLLSLPLILVGCIGMFWTYKQSSYQHKD